MEALLSISKIITRYFVLLFTFFFSGVLFAQQSIPLENPKFKTGDNMQWKEFSFDDSQWATINSKINWELQGYSGYDGYAWYRFHFQLPSFLKTQSFLKDSLRIFLNKVDDNDESYFNGQLIGKISGWNEIREYHISSNASFLKWDADNVIAVRVLDTGGPGGMFGGGTFVSMMDLIDGISMYFVSGGNGLVCQNSQSQTVTGNLDISAIDLETDDTTQISNTSVALGKGESTQLSIQFDKTKPLLLVATFTESKTGKILQISQGIPYILTPPVSDFPKINSAKAFGVRPGSPLLYKIAATGEKPLQYAAENLPEGLQVDANTGIITGTLTNTGDYQVTMKVTNAKGSAEKQLTIKVGDLLALTPPMGWNSWNCWGLSVSDQKVRSSAQAMIDKGLIDHGWTNINIDDGWEASQRDAAGNIVSNDKFPGMKALGDWLHSNGLKFGIYSSPGPTTCGGYLASYQHELKDATSYASWGIDYLKYDWCSYGNIAGNDGSLTALQKPYLIMRDALNKQPRDIVYSLCQYGMGNVWEWGDQVNGNCWRTTGDINDSWQSLSDIGFSQTVQYQYAKPGRWNDPDMLVVGQLGWGDNLRPTNLTPDEQYTHISLWCLLSAPLLIGCDISKMDDFTVNLLTNDEVIAVDQDVLGKQAQQMVADDSHQVWMKELEDGSYAVGIFNIKDTYQAITLHWNEIALNNNREIKIRDLWRQKDLGVFKDSITAKIPPHGVTLLKITKEPLSPFVADHFYYKILNVRTNNAIQVQNQSTALNAPLEMWASQPNNDNQEWEVIPLVDSTFQIINRKSGLSITGNGWGNNLIQTAPDTSNNAQQWAITPVDVELYGIENAKSGYAINNSGGSSKNGTAVVEYDNKISESLNQQWYFIKTETTEGLAIRQVNTDHLSVSVSAGVLQVNNLTGNNVISIYTLSGQLVFTVKTGSDTFKCALNRGNYILTVRGENNNSKVIVVK